MSNIPDDVMIVVRRDLSYMKENMCLSQNDRYVFDLDVVGSGQQNKYTIVLFRNEFSIVAIDGNDVSNPVKHAL